MLSPNPLLKKRPDWRYIGDVWRYVVAAFAIGNCSASVMGTTYPASGATLGPAMVFGYVAGAAAAAEEDLRTSGSAEGSQTVAASLGQTG